MLLRHIVPNNGVPFELDAITYAGETLDRLLADVKWRRAPCHHSAGLFQCREGGRRQDLVADACDNWSTTFALVAHLVPSRVVQERRPLRLEIGQRLPLQDVSQLVTGLPDKGRPKADRVDTVLFPRWEESGL